MLKFTPEKIIFQTINPLYCTKTVIMQILLPRQILMFAILVICTSLNTNAQDKTTPNKTDSVSTAPVDVSVVNAKNLPRKGEMVLFISQKTKKVYSGYTNAEGKLTTRLPAGDDYTVTVKAFTDSAKYGTLNIPALAAGQHFRDALGVDIMYEPGREFTLNDVKYDVGKATLRPESFKQLQELFEYLEWKTDLKIEIAGHTDNVGKAEDNLKLSQLRAESVREWLLKKGIGAGRIIAKGYGATHPIADNATDAGRQKNRRTEVHIVD